MDLFLLDSFVLLLVVIDPIGLVPMFVSLTRDVVPEQVRRMAVQGVLIAAAILFVFVVFGGGLLTLLGIGMPAFQVAGGILLFLLAVDMVFARGSGIRAATAPEEDEARHRKDISVFPLAIPLIAGPGAMTTLLLQLGDEGFDLVRIAALLAVLALVLAITLGALFASGRLMRWLGRTGANVVSRVLGVILAALAAQYVLDGWQAGVAY